MSCSPLRRAAPSNEQVWALVSMISTARDQVSAPVVVKVAVRTTPGVRRAGPREPAQACVWSPRLLTTSVADLKRRSQRCDVM
jgi:hypothetical protein